MYVGAFGVVHKGELKASDGTLKTVAIKTIKCELLYVYAHVCLCVCMHVCMCVCVHACMHACMRVCAHVQALVVNDWVCALLRIYVTVLCVMDSKE